MKGEFAEKFDLDSCEDRSFKKAAAKIGYEQLSKEFVESASSYLSKESQARPKNVTLEQTIEIKDEMLNEVGLKSKRAKPLKRDDVLIDELNDRNYKCDFTKMKRGDINYSDEFVNLEGKTKHPNSPPRLLRNSKRHFSTYQPKEERKNELINELKRFFNPPNTPNQNWNKETVKALFADASADERLNVKVKLIHGEIVKDFSKYCISAKYDIDLGTQTYLELAEGLQKGFSRLRAETLATHFVRFSGENTPQFFNKLTETCANANQSLLVLQLFYLFDSFGKIDEPQFDQTIKLLS